MAVICKTANGRVEAQRVALRHFSKPPPPNPTCNFHCIELSSRREVWKNLTTFPPTDMLNSLAASRLREPYLPACLPVPCRPVNGVTVSPDGRDPIDYRWDSLTIGRMPRRSSPRSVSTILLLECCRQPFHNLASTPCAVAPDSVPFSTPRENQRFSEISRTHISYF